MKRFLKSKEWIIWPSQHILPNPVLHYRKPRLLESYQVLAIDVSDIVEKGAVKKRWHLHYALDLFTLTCIQFKITERSTGKSLKNFTLTTARSLFFPTGCISSETLLRNEMYISETVKKSWFQ